MLRATRAFITVSALALAMAIGAAACGKDDGLKIKKIEPSEGPYTGGDPVTIYGSGFDSAAARSVNVYFDGKPATVLGTTGGEELVVVPPGIAALPEGQNKKPVKVTIIFSDSSKFEREGFYTYIDDSRQTVEDLLGGGKEGDKGTDEKK